MQLSELQSRTKSIPVTLPEGDIINLTYNINYDSPDNLKNFDGTIMDQARVLSSAITEWDIVDAKGKTVKPTLDVFNTFSKQLLGILMDALSTANNIPFLKTKENSDAI